MGGRKKPVVQPETAVSGLGRVWRELAARKVVQWGLGYVVVAFGLLQGISFIRSTFELPLSIDRIALTLLATGLPIALVIAWHHGDLGRQKVTRLEGGLLAACAAVGLVLTLAAAAPTRAEQRIARGEVPRLAVLRFENLGATEPYFAETVADELISFASRMKGMDVVARASSFSLTGAHATPAEAARQLGATLVMTGSVRREGDRVRVIAQLSEAPGGKEVWTQEFERPVDEIHLLQREIAAKVALAAGLTARAPPADRVNPEAYAVYMQGREAALSNDLDGFQKATDFFQQAVARDPGFAGAWSELADSSYQVAHLTWQSAPAGSVLTPQALAPALAAANRAIALDPLSPDGYQVKSRALRVLGRWREALDAADEAAKRGGAVAATYRSLGYSRRAIANARRAVDRNPLAAIEWAALGGSCARGGDPACQLEAAEHQARLQPTQDTFTLALALQRANRTDEAVKLMQTKPKVWGPGPGGSLTPEMKTTRAIFGEGEAPPTSWFIARIDTKLDYVDTTISTLLNLGRFDAIAPLLTRWGPDSRPELSVLFDTRLTRMRESPEFWALMQREGILQFWRASGQWPDFCEHEAVCGRYRTPAAVPRA